MTTVWFYTLASVLAVSAVSLIGVFTLAFSADRLKRVLFLLVSFSAGALFGDVFFHLLPEVTEEFGFGLPVSFSIVGGIAMWFLIEKVIHWRHCHHPVEDGQHIHPFAMMNLFGDLVHNVLDGVIIASSYIVSIPVGIATTIAVLAHEVPQEIGDFGVLMHGGFSKRKALFANFAISLSALFGAVVALILHASVENVTVYLVSFAAGSFLYIAGADLIPELHKEVRVRHSIFQFVAFMAGITVMVLLLGLE
jgi:zinc and cadmium transporter